jgi:hypothetical protein
MVKTKTPEYIEGSDALKKFEQFTTAILQANPCKKKKIAKQPKATSRKAKRSDKD